MAAIEQAEIERYQEEIERDLEGVYERFLTILEWDVPDADEPLARKLILDEMARALERMRFMPPSHRPSDIFTA